MDEDLVSPLFLTPTRGPIQVPGTINESRRAEALLRNLYKRIDVFPGQEATLTTAYSPAIGRRATLATRAPSGNRKLPTSTINFFGVNSHLSPSTNRYFNTFDVTDKPFAGGLKDAKLQGLLYQLGDFFNRAPAGGITGAGTEQQRRNVYQRLTGQALGPEGNAFIRPDGQFQPRDEKGRLGKAAPNPSKRLQSGLVRLAKGNVVRAAEPFMKQLFNVHPAIKGYYNFESIMQDITGKSPTREIIKSTSTQLKDTLTKEERLNVGPLLPF